MKKIIICVAFFLSGCQSSDNKECIKFSCFSEKNERELVILWSPSITDASFNIA